MKASNKIPEPLFDKKTIANLPEWAQSTVAILESLTPLVGNLVPIAVASILYNIVLLLMGK
jgi:hypothetical protein